MPAIQWASFNPATGDILEELPGAKLTSSLPTVIGRSAGSVQLSLPVADRFQKRRWEMVTRAGGLSVLAAVYDNDEQTVLWAGPVERRVMGNGPSIDLTLTDVPGWMDQQFLPNLTLLSTEQTAIARQVGLNQTAAVFNGQVAQTATTTTLDRRYKGSDDRTYLSALTELMGLNGGPEWAIGWRIDNGRLVCVPTVAPRIGRAALAGVYPVVLSRLPWTITEDYSPGKGATTVTGTASREGDQRISVTRTATVDRLPSEFRYQPDVAKSTTAQVTSHVDAKLAAISRGTRTLAIEIPMTSDIVVGRDIQLGDDIEADLTNDDLPELATTVRARVIGWSAEADQRTGQIVKITPILYGQES